MVAPKQNVVLKMVNVKFGKFAKLSYIIFLQVST